MCLYALVCVCVRSPLEMAAVCKAKFLEAVGKRTPILTRFSTVGGTLLNIEGLFLFL